MERVVSILSLIFIIAHFTLLAAILIVYFVDEKQKRRHTDLMRTVFKNIIYQKIRHERQEGMFQGDNGYISDRDIDDMVDEMLKHPIMK